MSSVVRRTRTEHRAVWSTDLWAVGSPGDRGCVFQASRFDIDFACPFTVPQFSNRSSLCHSRFSSVGCSSRMPKRKEGKRVGIATTGYRSPLGGSRETTLASITTAQTDGVQSYEKESEDVATCATVRCYSACHLASESRLECISVSRTSSCKFRSLLSIRIRHFA